jgi:hypothetical protein
MNPVSPNEKLIEAERLISADSDEAKTHGMLLLRDLIACPPVYGFLRPQFG